VYHNAITKECLFFICFGKVLVTGLSMRVELLK
jgi:hypothetical protein